MKPLKTLTLLCAAAPLAAAPLATVAADSPADAGRLTCTQDARDAARDPDAVRCIFTSADGAIREYYEGRIARGDRAGVGAGRVDMTWRVTTRARDLRPGALAGTYGAGSGTGLVRTHTAGRAVTLRRVVTVERRPVRAPTRLILRRLGTVEERPAPLD